MSVVSEVRASRPRGRSAACGFWPTTEWQAGTLRSYIPLIVSFRGRRLGYMGRDAIGRGSRVETSSEPRVRESAGGQLLEALRHTNRREGRSVTLSEPSTVWSDWPCCRIEKKDLLNRPSSARPTPAREASHRDTSRRPLRPLAGLCKRCLQMTTGQYSVVATDGLEGRRPGRQCIAVSTKEVHQYGRSTFRQEAGMSINMK